MEDKHREVLKANRMEIVRDLDVDNATSFLYSKSILSENDRDEIKAIKTLQSKSEKLLDTLPRRGPEAFGVFVKFLDETQPFLSKYLKLDTGLQGSKQLVDIRDGPSHSLDDKKLPQETDEELKPKTFDDTSVKPGNGSAHQDGKGSWTPNQEVEPIVRKDDEGDGRKRLQKGKHSSSHKDVIAMDDIYSMTHSPRGEAFIINNKIFLERSGMQKYPRNGTDVDRDALYELFTALGFKTTVYNDQTTKQIVDLFHRYASMDHSNYDCIICAVLTHGEEGLFYGTDGTIPIKELTSVFRGRLPGKPKLFFFQACQGFEYMEGIDLKDGGSPVEAKDEIDAPGNNKITLPLEADFMYAYSTVPGYYSWRNSAKGSWFVQAIDSVFRKYAISTDLLRMMTRVNCEVAKQKSYTNEYFSDNKKQIPSIVSQLRKELYFFPEHVLEDVDGDMKDGKRKTTFKKNKCLVS
ncbi:caspase-3-like isoform X2 [Xenia sp. Carnegie-2017]|uniref:caspase-3-like isoform X2 n=1 Tax=Xenia sp. Carnegie-2017 TaxID=2897299 RepID=UPI001F046223|nr:caspase-3-like isoform X2 [Xenia sp. Carnegie-2017]